MVVGSNNELLGGGKIEEEGRRANRRRGQKGRRAEGPSGDQQNHLVTRFRDTTL